jgi:hypothetical protein
MKKFLVALLHGHNIEITVMLGLAIVANVLHLWHTDHEKQVTSLTLAFLAVLSISLLRFRAQIEELTDVGPSVKLLNERSLLTPDYIAKSREADVIEIIALSGQMFHETYSKAELLRWVVVDGKRLRILILDSKGLAAKLRAKERGEEKLLLKIRDQEFRFNALCQELQREIDGRRGVCKGHLEVRRYDYCPYVAYFRADHDLIIGFYHPHEIGMKSHAILFEDPKQPAFERFIKHFERLWGDEELKEESDRSRLVCKIPAANTVDARK